MRVDDVLQQHSEISPRYAMFATPIACLIDEAGVVTRDVVVGEDAKVRGMESVEPEPGLCVQIPLTNTPLTVGCLARTGQALCRRNCPPSLGSP